MFFIRRKKINIFACVPVCVIPQIHINFFKHSPKTDINLLFVFYCKPAFHSRHATTTKNACNTTTEFLLCAKMQNMHPMNFWCLILTFWYFANAFFVVQGKRYVSYQMLLCGLAYASQHHDLCMPFKRFLQKL